LHSRRQSIIPIAIACLGAGMLLYWIGRARPLWVDEEMLLLNVRDRGFAGLAGALWLDQSAPLGWLMLERIALMTFGISEPALRLLPALFGIATLATAAWIGTRWMTPLGAAILVSLCAFGEWIVFFTLELKHYSADTCCALLVPAVAVWALEPDSPTLLVRRIGRWWIVAAIAHWFSNGGLFVTPGCAAVVTVACWRRGGWRLAARASLGAVMWAGSFAACYALVLRHAIANTYLRDYWAFAFPPVSAGAGATFAWLLNQFEPFATKPASSGLWLMFWIAYSVGILIGMARQRRLALMFATTPVSALALAALHIVPTFERLALWVVPSLYVGVALCGDAAVWLIRRPIAARGWFAGVFGRRIERRARRERPEFVGEFLGGLRGVCVRSFALFAAATAAWVSGDVVHRGVMAIVHKPMSNYGLDDRSSIRWLLATHRPGDVVLTTHYGLAALWWYGKLNVSDPERSGTLADGSPVFELQYAEPGAECERAGNRLAAALGGHQRAAVYLGFRMNVLPPGFDSLVLQDLGARGALVGYKPYAEESRLAIFDLAEPARSATNGSIAPDSRSNEASPVPAGCVTVVPARRW
jgi:hypothetical protein